MGAISSHACNWLPPHVHLGAFGDLSSPRSDWVPASISKLTPRDAEIMTAATRRKYPALLRPKQEAGRARRQRNGGGGRGGVIRHSAAGKALMQRRGRLAVIRGLDLGSGRHNRGSNGYPL